MCRWTPSVQGPRKSDPCIATDCKCMREITSVHSSGQTTEPSCHVFTNTQCCIWAPGISLGLQHSSSKCYIPYHPFNFSWHRSWSVSQSLEHLEGVPGTHSPIPSRLNPSHVGNMGNPSNLGPARSSPISSPSHGSHRSMHPQADPAQHHQGLHNGAEPTFQQPSANPDVLQYTSPFQLQESISPAHSLSHLGSQEHNQEDQNMQSRQQQPSTSLFESRPKSPAVHPNMNAPLELIPERSERDSAMSMELAEQMSASLSFAQGPKGQLNGPDLMHSRPPSMQWQH